MRTKSIFALHCVVRRPVPVLPMMILLGTLIVTDAAGDEPKVPAPRAGAPTSAPSESPLPSTVPPEIVKPVPPKSLESAESVFRELDINKRGYVTRDETKDLLGFEDAFRAVDKRNSGRLTLEQFRKAWSIYKQP